MGLSPFHFSKCDCGISKGELSVVFSNPRPKNFKITEAFVVDDYVAVVVNYPDATNFEGNKIMVYKASLHDVTHQTELDPHFCDGSHLSPIARFRPTVEGRNHAIQFMLLLAEGK